MCVAALTATAVGLVTGRPDAGTATAGGSGTAAPQVPAAATVHPAGAPSAPGVPSTPPAGRATWQPPVPTGLTGPVEQVLADAPATGPVRIVTLARGADGAPHVTVTTAPDRAHAADAVTRARAVPGALSVTVDQRVHVDDVGAPTPVTAAGTGARPAARASVATTISNDTYRGQQWALDTLQAETAWGLHTAGGQTVAVIDTGVDGTHPDLAGVVLPGTDVLGEYPDGRSDPEGHGTHVAGIVDAVAGNGIGVAGLAQRAAVLPVRVLDANGQGWSSDITTGIIWAADHGATVISMSLGGGDYAPMDSAISYARSLGVVVVAAVGNSQQTGNPVQYPGASPGVIGVAATDEYNAGAGFSETGPQVDIAAPGVDIASTYPVAYGSYVYMDGTSMATPYVSAAAALVRSAAPGLTPDQVATVLTATATDLGAAGRDDVYGAGLVSPVAAVRAALSGAVVPVAPRVPTGVTAVAGDRSATVSWTAPADGGSPITGYTVVASPGGATVTTTGATTATVAGLANGTAYTFTVSATNAVGTGSPSPATRPVTPATTPDAPSGVAAVAGRAAATVTWTAPANGGSPITGYTVVASPGGATVGTTGATTATLTGLTNGTAYTVTVTATNAVGTGAASAPSAAVTPAADRLLPGQQLAPGDALVSPNGQYRFVLQTDGNAVVYGPDQRPLWYPRTWGNPGAQLTLQSDGNVVVSTAGGAVLWHSATWGNPGSALLLQDDGNLVLYSVAGRPLWFTGPATAPADTLFALQQLTAGQQLTAAGGRYSLVVQGDGNLVLYGPGQRALWSSRTWGQPGARLQMQSDGNPVVYTATRRAAWNATTGGSAGARLVLQGDGNLVVYSAGGRALWSSMFGRAR